MLCSYNITLITLIITVHQMMTDCNHQRQIGPGGHCHLGVLHIIQHASKRQVKYDDD